MLSLGFSNDDSLVIGDLSSEDVVIIRVVRIQPGRVRLAIHAPEKTRVDRLLIAVRKMQQAEDEPSKSFEAYFKKLEKLAEADGM